MNPEHYLGFPWKVGGRSPEEGFDCWGLFRFVYFREFGISVNEHPAPVECLALAPEVVGHELASGNWKQVVSPVTGDVVALAKQRHDFTHLGVYVEAPAPSILHSIEGYPSCVTALKTLYRQGYGEVRFYRHKSKVSNG